MTKEFEWLHTTKSNDTDEVGNDCSTHYINIL